MTTKKVGQFLFDRKNTGPCCFVVERQAESISLRNQNLSISWASAQAVGINLFMYCPSGPSPSIILFIYLRCVPLNTPYFVTGVTSVTATAPPSQTLTCHSLYLKQKQHICTIIFSYEHFSYIVSRRNYILTRNIHMIHVMIILSDFV